MFVTFNETLQAASLSLGTFGDTKVLLAQRGLSLVAVGRYVLQKRDAEHDRDMKSVEE